MTKAEKSDWEVERDLKNAKIDAYIETLKLVYEADFVPHSVSRNKNEKHKNVNWVIRIGRAGQVNKITGKQTFGLVTDYSQGVGHIPHYQQSLGKSDGWKTIYYDNICETGKYHHPKTWQRFNDGRIDWWSVCNRVRIFDNPKPLPKPKLRDVLYSLMMDCDVLNYSSFEDWAPSLGYNEDSIKAKKLYEQCLNLALTFKNMMSSESMEKLQELYQDY